MADFAYDAQNPWFSKQTSPTDPASGGNGAGGTSVDASGWDWSKGFHNANPAGDLNTVLDPSKWQSWGTNDWNLATGGYGNNESSFLGNLQKNMGNDDLYHNYMNTYGPGGTRHLTGAYDWTTHAFSRPDVSAEAIKNADTAPMFGGGNLSNPDPKHPGYSVQGYAGDPLVTAANQARLRAEQANTQAQLERERAYRHAGLVKGLSKTDNIPGVLKKPFDPDVGNFGPPTPGAPSMPTRPGVVTPPVTPAVTSVSNVNRLIRSKKP